MLNLKCQPLKNAGLATGPALWAFCIEQWAFQVADLFSNLLKPAWSNHLRPQGYGGQGGPGLRVGMLADGLDDLLAPSPDITLVLPLEHHTQERLGPRIADEQPSVAFEL